MKSHKHVVGTLVVSAPVYTTLAEASIPDSAPRATRQAFTQLGQALAAFGPFDLGYDMSFVEAGIKISVVDAGKEHHAHFDQTAFEAFVQRAHNVCADALHAPGESSEQLAGAAEDFATDEERDVDTIKGLFNSLVTQHGFSLISKDGELIHVGVDSRAEDDDDMEIDVARIRHIVRIITTQGQYDVPSECAEGLRVGHHICLDGIEPPSGAACVRAESIDAGPDPTGELFDDSAAAQPASNPDHTE